jgi:CNT family concentrative nucleoside transporter
MTIMTSGMAHVSGGIMAMYIAQGVEARAPAGRRHHDLAGNHSDGQDAGAGDRCPATEGRVVIPKDELHKEENFIGAIARGTIDGGKLAMNVAIMLISFLALVALLDSLLRLDARLAYMHWVPGSLGQILGFLFAPVAWLIGVPWHDCGAIGNLLGTRMALNEVIAYIALGAQKATLRRAPSPSPPLRCADLRTWARSGCKSAASARWFPSGATTWPGWACAPCSPGPWPT